MYSKLKFAELEERIDREHVPKHVAIIMDGNRRWARRHGLTTNAGHEAGVKAVKRAVETARDLGIDVLSLYAFSTENWRRSRSEVSALWRMLRRFVHEEIERLREENVRLVVMGHREDLPVGVRRDIAAVEEATADKRDMLLNIAINYGGQQEIVDAVRRVVADVAAGNLAIEEIDPGAFNKRLYTADMPELELLIRTSGEYRISNFMLWQVSYAELYFTGTLWPDFSKKHFLRAVLEFQHRQRRFGASGKS